MREFSGRRTFSVYDRFDAVSRYPKHHTAHGNQTNKLSSVSSKIALNSTPSLEFIHSPSAADA